MRAKSVEQTRISMAVGMMPADANPGGNVHGGVIMKYIDTTAGVVAARHTGVNAVTASIDRLDFYSPVYVGNILSLKASLNLVGKTSMEIGVRVEAENPRTGQVRHTASAYLTFVALDKNGKPTKVPELILDTEEDVRRNEEAKERRRQRLMEKVREGKSQGKGRQAKRG